jgi:hypothetical protein
MTLNPHPEGTGRERINQNEMEVDSFEKEDSESLLICAWYLWAHTRNSGVPEHQGMPSDIFLSQGHMVICKQIARRTNAQSFSGKRYAYFNPRSVDCTDIYS